MPDIPIRYPKEFEDDVPDKKTRKKPAREDEIPIPKVYPVIDNDLARDNIENNITAADRQDL